MVKLKPDLRQLIAVRNGASMSRRVVSLVAASGLAKLSLGQARKSDLPGTLGHLDSCQSDEEFLETLPDSHRQFLQIGAWDINLVGAGTGPSLLFLHGLGVSWRWWEPVLTTLVPDFTVTAIDLPGAGESSPLTAEPTLADYAELVSGVLETIGPSVIVGHSLGGFVAVQAALQQVSSIKGLFLAAPAGFGPIENKYFRLMAVPGLGSLLNKTGEMGLPLLLKSLVHRKAVVEEMLCWVDSSAPAREQFLFQIQMGLDGLGRTSKDLIITDASSVTVPVSLVWGRHDSVFSIDTALNAEQMLSARSLEIAEDSGHFLQLEETEWFVRALRQFIGGVF